MNSYSIKSEDDQPLYLQLREVSGESGLDTVQEQASCFIFSQLSSVIGKVVRRGWSLHDTQV